MKLIAVNGPLLLFEVKPKFLDSTWGEVVKIFNPTDNILSPEMFLSSVLARGYWEPPPANVMAMKKEWLEKAKKAKQDQRDPRLLYGGVPQ